jgi:hypothetical protein
MATTIASTDVGGTGLSTVGTNGQVLTSNGTTLSWQTPSAGTSFSAGTTGFTPNTATTGTVTLAGTLNVANGGTGQTSFNTNYVLIGNGTSGVYSSSSLQYNGATLSVTGAISAGSLSLTSALPVASGGTGVTTSTGSGSSVLNNNSTFTGTITMPSSASGLVIPAFSTTNQGSNQDGLWLTRASSANYQGIAFRGVIANDYGIYQKANDDGLYFGYWGGGGAYTDTLKLDTSKNATFYGTLYNASGRPMVNQTGGILQVISVTSNSQTTYTRTQTMTPWTLTITPSSTSSQIIIYFNIGLGTNTASDLGINCNRNGTQLQGGTGASGTNATWVPVMNESSGDFHQQTLFLVDSPATTSAVTYTFTCYINANTMYVNRRGGDTSFSSSSMAMAMEVAG